MFVNSGVKSSVWVHNDMLQEIKCKGNQNRNILKEAYSRTSNVCVVSPSLIEPTSEISGRKDNIHVVHNLNDYDSIAKRADEELTINDNTVVYNNDINKVLEKDGFKFITIGRFSSEKGHKRLIEAFSEFCRDYPDSQLIIIGGYGVEYERTSKLVDSIDYGDNITLINNISNPMPILKQCDLFILSSFYEGWPMVIMEADTLDVPIISTDIQSTRRMGEYGGYLVENSLEGLLNGMYDFANGKVMPLNSDYEQYNKNAITEFYDILK